MIARTTILIVIYFLCFCEKGEFNGKDLSEDGNDLATTEFFDSKSDNSKEQFEDINNENLFFDEEMEFEEVMTQKGCNNSEFWGVPEMPNENVQCQDYPRMCYYHYCSIPAANIGSSGAFFFPVAYDYKEGDKTFKIKGWWNNGDACCVMYVLYYLLPTGWITLEIDIENEKVSSFEFTPLERFMAESGYGIIGLGEGWQDFPAKGFYKWQEDIVFDFPTAEGKNFTIYKRFWDLDEYGDKTAKVEGVMDEIIQVKRPDGSEDWVDVNVGICMATIEQIYKAGCLCGPPPTVCVAEVLEKESYFSFVLGDEYIILWDSSPESPKFWVAFSKEASHINAYSHFTKITLTLNGTETGNYPKPHIEGKYGSEDIFRFNSGIRGDKKKPNLYDPFEFGNYLIAMDTFDPVYGKMYDYPQDIGYGSLKGNISKIEIGKCQGTTCEGFIEGTFEGKAREVFKTNKLIPVTNGKFRIYGRLPSSNSDNS